MKVPILTNVYYKYHENEWPKCQYCQVQKIYGRCFGYRCGMIVKAVNNIYFHLPTIFISQEDKTL